MIEIFPDFPDQKFSHKFKETKFLVPLTTSTKKWKKDFIATVYAVCRVKPNKCMWWNSFFRSTHALTYHTYFVVALVYETGKYVWGKSVIMLMVFPQRVVIIGFENFVSLWFKSSYSSQKFATTVLVLKWKDKNNFFKLKKVRKILDQWFLHEGKFCVE